jgi:hypothetical protein
VDNENMKSNPCKSPMDSYLELADISLDLGDIGPAAVASSEDFVLDIDLEEIIEASAIAA